MTNLLLQLDALTDVHRAIRDHFQKGGSAMAALLAILALLSLVALAYFLTEWQRRAANRGTIYDNPHALFRHLLEELSISGDDRRWLETVVKATRTTHPATLLISVVLFDERTSKWQARGGKAQTDAGLTRRVAALRRRLFPGAGPIESKAAP